MIRYNDKHSRHDTNPFIVGKLAASSVASSVAMLLRAIAVACGLRCAVRGGRGRPPGRRAKSKHVAPARGVGTSAAQLVYLPTPNSLIPVPTTHFAFTHDTTVANTYCSAASEKGLAPPAGS